jgi:hypothetical protein
VTGVLIMSRALLAFVVFLVLMVVTVVQELLPTDTIAGPWPPLTLPV